MLTGFELDLYAADEKPFAYWYLAQLFAIHEGILGQLTPSISPSEQFSALVELEVGTQRN